VEGQVKVRKKPGTKPGEKIITRQMRFDLLHTLREHGFDPLDRLLKLYEEADALYNEAAEGYLNADETKTIKNQWLVNSRWRMKMEVAEKLMEYVYPKRKSLELTGANGEDIFKSFVDVVRSVRDEMEKAQAIDAKATSVCENV
jgi:hypothetical protein